MKAARKVIKRCRQQGQVLVLLLPCILGLWLGLVYISQLSERVQQRSHMQIIADSAATAFATIAARDLNYKAVTNRAMLANHIAMAQLVGLSSWLAMINETTRHTALITSWVPYLNAVMLRLSQSLQQFQQPFNQSVQTLLQGQRLIVDLLSASQLLFHGAAAATALRTSQQVVENVDDSLQLVLLNHATLPDLAYTWLTYQSRERSAAMFTDLLSQSRDPFTQRRSYRWFNVPGAVSVRAQKWGGSEPVALGHGQMSWQAVDVAALRVRMGPFSSYWVPLGRGASHVGMRPPSSGAVEATAFGGAYAGRRALSRQAALSSRYLGPVLSIPYYQQVDPSRDFPRITMVVRERQAPHAFAIARAKVRFSRPSDLWPRRDGLSEQANAWNSLWVAQLSSISVAEQWLLEQQL